MPGVWTALVGEDASGPVHGPQVLAVLADLEAVGVKLAASLKDLQVAELSDQSEVVVDEEHHLLLVDLSGKMKA